VALLVVLAGGACGSPAPVASLVDIKSEVRQLRATYMADYDHDQDCLHDRAPCAKPVPFDWVERDKKLGEDALAIRDRVQGREVSADAKTSVKALTTAADDTYRSWKRLEPCTANQAKQAATPTCLQMSDEFATSTAALYYLLKAGW
jgi:hypothetical protein